MTEQVPADLNDHLSTASPLSADLKELAALIDHAARVRQGDSAALLALLRLLEERHRHICDTLFRDALPNNRHNLYSLLRDIELNGGWPYIQRMKLQALFANIPTPEVEPPPPTMD
ncbi:MAG: hypothetical protein HC922_11265 [Leptolyngbyaceae cyanobacterium SM2_3_12]|nr:hypothetical protein [Leptolyngbyaceae cyanobacterium SM2_3_12]